MVSDVAVLVMIAIVLGYQSYQVSALYYVADLFWRADLLADASLADAIDIEMGELRIPRNRDS